MKTTPVAANGYQLTRLGFVNCYLVREADGFSLIDTGLPGSADDILAAARLLGAPIRRIVLTHAHMDHVGSVDALVEKLGSVELVSNARSVRLLQTPPDTSLQPNEAQGKIKGGVRAIKAKPTLLLAEGDLIGSLRAIDTPGQYPATCRSSMNGTAHCMPGMLSSAKAASQSAGSLRGSFPCRTFSPGINQPPLPAQRSYWPILSSSLPAATAQSRVEADLP